jgi:hypothetical protein
MNFPDYSHFVNSSHTISMIGEPLFTPEINNIFQNSTHGKFPRQMGSSSEAKLHGQTR